MFALVGLGLGLLLFALRGATYDAEALVAVSNPTAAVRDEIANVTSPTVIEAAANELGFEPQISVTAAEVARLLTINATDSNPQRAAAAANAVAETYTRARLGAPASIVRQAEVPTEASGLGALMFALVGTLLGMGAGTAAGPVLRLRAAQAPTGPSPAGRIDRLDERPASRPNAFASAVRDPVAGRTADPTMIDLGESRRGPAPRHARVLVDASAVSGGRNMAAYGGSVDDSVLPEPAVAMTMPERPSLGPPADPPSDKNPRAPMSSDIPSPSNSRQPESAGARSGFLGIEPDRSARRIFRLDDDHAEAPMFDRSARRTESGRFFRSDREDDDQPTPPSATADTPTPTEAPEPTGAPRTETPAGPTAPEPPAPEPPAPAPSSSGPPEPRWADGHVVQTSEVDPTHVETTDVDPTEFDGISRRDHEARLEAARAELALSHAEDVARLRSEHQRAANDLRNEVSRLTKQLRLLAAGVANRTKPDQNRVGDLEAQVDALEIELAQLRQTLESERIGHAKRITDERGAADRALDNARRQHREELAKHLHSHRQALADYRNELDSELAQDRARHAAALERQHLEYEAQIEAERNRVESTLRSVAERHERELEAARTAGRSELARQAEKYKATIAQLRIVSEAAEERLRELEKANRMLQAELGTQMKQAGHAEADHATSLQQVREELVAAKHELESERERNAALRADVLRRSAGSHQAVDHAAAERTAQLAELEASVARQRQYADARVREVSEAAEEQARESAAREAELTATISRLKRELAASQRSAAGPSVEGGQV